MAQPSLLNSLSLLSDRSADENVTKINASVLMEVDVRSKMKKGRKKTPHGHQVTLIKDKEILAKSCLHYLRRHGMKIPPK
jgi:hypothetical protein